MKQEKQWIKEIIEFTLDCLFPEECIHCGKWSTWLCDACCAAIPLTEPHHDALQTMRHKNESTITCTALDGLIIMSPQGSILMNAIRYLKYQNTRLLAQKLAALLEQKIQSSPLASVLFMNHDACLIPVPLHRKKEWDRGYNQSALIANIVQQSWPITYSPEVVVRVQSTKSQTTLTKTKRIQNMKNAFVIINPGAVVGKTVVILDDIITTGATMCELARVITKAGAKEVWGCALMSGAV